MKDNALLHEEDDTIDVIRFEREGEFETEIDQMTMRGLVNGCLAGIVGWMVIICFAYGAWKIAVIVLRHLGAHIG